MFDWLRGKPQKAAFKLKHVNINVVEIAAKAGFTREEEEEYGDKLLRFAQLLCDHVMSNAFDASRVPLDDAPREVIEHISRLRREGKGKDGTGLWST